MRYFYKILTFLAILLLNFSKAQTYDYSYGQLSKLFNRYTENDPRGLVYVNLYILKAKKEKRYAKLVSGYDEASYYSNSVNNKIAYADSAIAVSRKMNDVDLISWSYLRKGIIFYYNKRNYREALRYYLKAFDYAKNTKDFYMKNKIVYHLGMVRLYLGYYEEAACHFTETANFYEHNILDRDHPNIKLNNEEGYFNSIYRLSSCYRYMEKYKKEDSLIEIGLKKIRNSKELAMEYAYFQKGKGIQLLRKNKSKKALSHLKLAESILFHQEDYASLATTEFYLGKVYWLNKEIDSSIMHFKKADSLMSKFKFITPEINSNYQYLILDAKSKGDDREQLFYTNKLISLDSVMKADFAYLSSRIHREYDVGSLTEDRNNLMKSNKIGKFLLALVICASSCFLYYFINRFRKKEERLNIKYNELLEKLKTVDNANDEIFSDIHSDELGVAKEKYSPEIIDKIKANLLVFQKKEKFRDKNLTLDEAAKIVGCKRNALSYVINAHLHTNFQQYLKVLRIQYITKKLWEDETYLKYTMDALAKECGMKNRIVFSNNFLEINGMRPVEFVRKRMEEIQREEEE